MSKSLDLNRYTKAIKLLKEMIEKSVAIKKTHFLKDHKLSAFFFHGLEAIGAIKEEIGYHREGVLYSWHYKQADNEQDSFLATRICNWITDSNRQYRESKAQPLALKDRKNKVIKKWKDEQKEIHGKDSPNGTPLVPISESRIHVGSTESILVDGEKAPQPQPIKNITTQTLLTLNIVGHLTKAELLAKLSILIEEAPVTSFKIEVAY